MTEPALVLLHAFPLDARMWDGIREPLAQRLRVITPDQRGLGRTPLPDTERRPDLDDAARDVVALLDRLELDRVVLGGCSMGGYLTMAVLRLAPERVAGLVLLGTKAGADDADARANRLATAERIESEGTGFVADAMLPALLGETSRQQRPTVVARVRELIEEQSATGLAWAQRAMAQRPDSTSTLAAADVPALVVVGEQDSLSPLDQAHAMAEALPQPTLEVLPSVGHLAPVEDPAAVAEAILTWWPAPGG